MAEGASTHAAHLQSSATQCLVDMIRGNKPHPSKVATDDMFHDRMLYRQYMFHQTTDCTLPNAFSQYAYPANHLSCSVNICMTPLLFPMQAVRSLFARCPVRGAPHGLLAPAAARPVSWCMPRSSVASPPTQPFSSAAQVSVSNCVVFFCAVRVVHVFVAVCCVCLWWFVLEVAVCCIRFLCCCSHVVSV